MPPTPKAKHAKKNAGTQTSEMDTILEIARLQEQVKLLTIENEHLRKYTVEKPSSILKLATPSRSPTNVEDIPKATESKKKGVQTQSARKRSSKVAMRGCTCKGNCSTKICGCVKKDIQCGELCRCSNSICQNQEEKGMDADKENVENNEITHVEHRETTNKHLANVTAHKSVFSPDVTTYDSTPLLESYKPSSIYFGSPKTLTFVSDEEEEKDDKDKKVKKKSAKNDKYDGQGVTRRRGRPKRNNLEVNNAEYTRKLRSSSSEEIRGQSNMGIETQALRRCSSGEIQIQPNVELKKIEKQTNNHLGNTFRGMVSLQHYQKIEQNSVKETIKSSTDPDTQGTRAATMEDNAKKASQDATIQVSKSLDQWQMDSSVINNLHESGSCNEYDFDPMKPKHELSRTPTHGNSDTSSRNNSDTWSPTPVVTIKEEEQLPIPAEFNQAEVNWELYQSQLVACKKCKRKFHPLRVQKHQACCKRV